MSIHKWFAFTLAAAVLFGCGGGSGGGGGAQDAEVSGIVTDFDGAAVRGARVWIDQFGETDSNSNGSYVLEDVSEGEWKIRAEVTRDGVRYRGENLAQTFPGERAKSVNITVIRESLMMRVFGTVIDNQGFPVRGARVFAMAPNDGGVFSSTVELTDSDGRFDLDTLMSNVDYRIVASGLGFNSDVDVVNVAAGNEVELVLALKNPTDPALPAPTGLQGVSWVSPRETTRSPQQDSAYQNIKRIFDPRTPQRSLSRDSSGGNYVEVDLFWDAYPNDDAHIGFGIYRFLEGDQWRPLDFLRDPEAELYIDLDSSLLAFDTASYVVTAISTLEDESADSNTVTVDTLDDLELNTTLQGPLTFRWQSGSGAQTFNVYLFDEYPSIGVDSMWTGTLNSAGTQLVYSGPSLQSGHRYYFIVLGLANSDTSRTISRVGEFIAN
jgi:hypothetical protein